MARASAAPGVHVTVQTGTIQNETLFGAADRQAGTSLSAFQRQADNDGMKAS